MAWIFCVRDVEQEKKKLMGIGSIPKGFWIYLLNVIVKLLQSLCDQKPKTINWIDIETMQSKSTNYWIILVRSLYIYSLRQRQKIFIKKNGKKMFHSMILCTCFVFPCHCLSKGICAWKMNRRKILKELPSTTTANEWR